MRCGVAARRGAVRCGAARCGAVRCGAVRCGAVRCGAVRCGAVRCGAVRCGAVRCGAVRCGAVRCGAVRCDAARRGAVRCGAVLVPRLVRHFPRPSQSIDFGDGSQMNISPLTTRPEMIDRGEILSSRDLVKDTSGYLRRPSRRPRKIPERLLIPAKEANLQRRPGTGSHYRHQSLSIT